MECINTMNFKKILYLLGPTASTKTKTSISICTKFPFQIVNTDVFACYKGKGIMTAKVTEEEQKLAKHHLINILEQNETSFNMADYKEMMTSTCLSIQNSNEIPLIVGGTNYYVEHSLFTKEPGHDSCETENKSSILERKNKFLTKLSDSIDEDLKKTIMMLSKIDPEIDKNLLESALKVPSAQHCEQLEKLGLANLDKKTQYEMLQVIDNKSYVKYHENDFRKVQNALLFFFTNFITKSEDNSNFKRIVSNPQSYVIYLKPSKDLISNKIRVRLITMLNEEGGFIEIYNVLAYFMANSNGSELDFNKGYLQAIGYKEFFPLFIKIYESKVLKIEFEKLLSLVLTDFTEGFKNFLKFHKLSSFYDECLDRLIISTNQYAKYQIKFIEKRIVPFISPSQLLIVDPNEADYMQSIFSFVSVMLANHEISNTTGNHHKNLSIENIDSNLISTVKCCQICGISKFPCETEYSEHLKSKKHKHFVKKQNALSFGQLKGNEINAEI